MEDLSGATLPTKHAEVPLQSIRVEVIEGPDQGLSLQGEDDTLTVGTADGNTLMLSDPTVSRYHLSLRRKDSRIEVVDHDSTNGTSIGPARLKNSFALLRPGSEIEVGRSRLRLSDGEVVKVAVPNTVQLGGLRGNAPSMRRLMAQIQKVAPRDVSVLVLGESGTGKELVARAIHEKSERSKGPLVVVDCASLPANLIASELFGHERGAFTGAQQRRTGAFERADGGTLFLDEIGELPPEHQSTLLGVLERRSFRRVGGSEEVHVDVRVVSATHRNLRAQVNAEQFRLDLFYRVAVVVLETPPLRDRPEDIPLLVEKFIREDGYDEPLSSLISDEVMERFRRHAWPGNVRELRNMVAATVALGESPRFAEGLASPDAQTEIDGHDDDLLEQPFRDAKNHLVGQFERKYLTRLLERSDGSVRKAAKIARMDRSYLTELIKRHDLK